MKPLRQAVCSEIALQSGQAPEWIEIIPLGAIQAVDGRAWTLQDAEAVIRASARPKTQLVIDRDHETDFAAKGTQIRAAGWIESMEVRNGSIWAKTSWTARAEQEIVGREYRYLSPVFKYDQFGNVTKILRASLTNDPALELTALSSRQAEETSDEEKETNVKDFLEKLALAMGLDKSSDQEAILAACTQMKNDNTAATAFQKDVRAAVQVGDKADAAAVCTAIKTLQEKTATASNAEPDPAKYVPVQAFNEVKDQVATLSANAASKVAEDKVAAAMRDGKVTPGQKEWATAYASRDPQGFDDYIKTAPVIVAPGETTKTATASAAANAGNGSSEEKAVCAQLGIDPSKLNAKKEGTEE